MFHNEDEDEIGEEVPWLLSPPESKRRISFVIPIILAIFALFAGVVMWGGFQKNRTPHDIRAANAVIPPKPQLEALDQRLRAISAEEAVLANAEIRISVEPVEPAKAFTVPLSEAMAFSRQSALNCLTAAIYYEAANEPDQGQRAVAQVVLNRVRHPAYPNSVCEVVFQGSERKTGCQFSFTCDGSLARKPSENGWNRARRAALLSLSGMVEPSVGMATHYHAVYVLPYWASSLDKITTIGAHIFYRWKGYWGKRASFSGGYAGEISDPTAGSLSLDAASAASSDLLLGDGGLNTTSGPGSSGVTAHSGQLLSDQAGLQLKPNANDTLIKADDDKRRPAADDNNGVLLGPR